MFRCVGHRIRVGSHRGLNCLQLMYALVGLFDQDVEALGLVVKDGSKTAGGVFHFGHRGMSRVIRFSTRLDRFKAFARRAGIITSPLNPCSCLPDKQERSSDDQQHDDQDRKDIGRVRCGWRSQDEGHHHLFSSVYAAGRSGFYHPLMDASAQGTMGGNALSTSVAVKRHNVVTEVSQALLGPCKIPRGGTVVAAVSGGADSIALLLALRVLQNRSEKIRTIVVHVNHALRESARDDELHVATLARQLDVPFVARTVYPAREPGNTLAQARRLRYLALRDVAQDVGAAAIATAHHADDQFETMLMAFCRGAGLDGLRGLRYRRFVHGTVVVRPLLKVPKESLRTFCRLAGVAWREDPSNGDQARVRARLRQTVLPALESMWPGAATRAVVTGEMLDESSRILKQYVRKKFGPAQCTSWPRRHLATLSPVVLGAGLRRAVREQFRLAGCSACLSASTTSRTWRQVAAAIRDAQEHERCFQIGSQWLIRVDARTVEVLAVPTGSIASDSAD